MKPTPTLLNFLIGLAVPMTGLAQLPPALTTSTLPQSKAAYVGTRASFTVTATGTAPLSFQWRLDGRDLPGQTNRTRTFNSVQPADEGDYSVVVTNAAGAVVTDPARLYVVPASTSFVLKNSTNTAGLRLPYFFFLPANYDPARSYPLICHFHGGGVDETSRGEILTPYPETLVFGSYQQQAKDPAILVWPTRRAGGGEWTSSYIQQTSELLDWMLSNFNIDTNRVYVAGYSEGGHAVWDLMGLRPGLFAAARILSGWQGTSAAASIKDVPLWVFCAADDDVTSSRNLVRAFRASGGSALYTEFRSGGHIDGILQALCIPTGVDWFLAQRRGVKSAVGPSISITGPTQDAAFVTSATTLNLAGSAETPARFIAPVTWQNSANGLLRNAVGTNAWSATDIPLQPNRTNMIVVTATTTSWAPAFGGTTTFNDTIEVVSLPILATLTAQGSSATLNWTGGAPPYRVQRAAELRSGDWVDVWTNTAPPITLLLEQRAEFYRIVGQ